MHTVPFCVELTRLRTRGRSGVSHAELCSALAVSHLAQVPWRSISAELSLAGHRNGNKWRTSLLIKHHWMHFQHISLTIHQPLYHFWLNKKRVCSDRCKTGRFVEPPRVSKTFIIIMKVCIAHDTLHNLHVYTKSNNVIKNNKNNNNIYVNSNW